MTQSAHAPEPGKKRDNFDALARQKTHSGFTRPEQWARGAANRAGDRKEQPFPGSDLCASYALSYALSAGFSAGYMRRGNILRERPQRRSSEPQPQRPRGRGRAEAAKKEADGRTCAWPRGARPKRPQRNMTRSPAGALAEAGFLFIRSSSHALCGVAFLSKAQT